MAYATAMWLSLFFSAPAQADCNLEHLEQVLDGVDKAYVAANRTQLVLLMRTANGLTECASYSPGLSSRVHLGRALIHALDRDWDEARIDLRASIASQPLRRLPVDLERDQRLHLAWLRAQEQPTVWTLAGPPVLVNGTLTPLLPDTPVLGAARRRNRTPLRVAALGVGLVGAGLYGAAWSNRANYDKALRDNNLATARTRYTATNRLAIGSLGAGVLGAGLLGVSFAL